MRVLSRGWLLVLISVVATLVVPTSVAAAADDVYLLAAPVDSYTPQYLRPLVQTVAGTVYRNTYSSTTWVDPPGSAPPVLEDRLPEPVVIGDLISSYDSASTTLRWRTIAETTLHETVVASELTYVDRTSTGYLAREGNGPYDLVAVDLLDGGTGTAFGTAAEVEGAIAGPLGVAVPTAGSDEWRYYPYDGSVTAGQPVQAPEGAEDCQLTTAHLFCWSATALTRLPLSGDPGATAAGSPASLVGTPDGVAYTIPDARYLSGGYHQVWVWRSGASAPVLALDGDRQLTADLAPVIGGTDLALAAKTTAPSVAGIYRISSTLALAQVVQTSPEPLAASEIALGPGRVAWSSNRWFNGEIHSRLLGRAPDGGFTVISSTTQLIGSDGAALSVNGSRLAYARNWGTRGLVLNGVIGDPQLDAAEVLRSTVSGQRVLWQSRNSDGVLAWQLTDLTSKTTSPLAAALSYDLWGERLARLDADGSVWTQDLRTGTAPAQIAAALAEGAERGTLRVAGDLVAWDVDPADDDAADPGVFVRDVVSMDPAEPVRGLSALQDLSTGYAVGYGCSEDADCSPRAVSLIDGAIIPVDTARPLAVDGNILGFITSAGMPALRTLPEYDDRPRLLASTGAATTVDLMQRWFRVRVAASQPLTGCRLEIRDDNAVLVRSVPCSPSQNGATTAEWNGSSPTALTVPSGTYSWQLIATNGDRPLVDYDGSTTALSGTMTVIGEPEPEPEPDPVVVPLPDLGMAHRRSDGGVNLFRMALSELDYDPGVAQLVRTLPASSGVRFDRSTVLAGDFANLTSGDDGTADHAIWQMGPDGGVRLYTVAGGSDSKPRLAYVLPRTAGWSWADSRPVVGDLNGDGWDDLLVVHRARTNIVWALISNGTRLGAPQRWGTVAGDFAGTRYSVADADGDGKEDLLMTGPAPSSFRTTTLLTRPDGTAALPAPDPFAATFRAADGWSLPYSRQLAGDVTADGFVDLVTIHRSGTGGVLVWVSANCSVADGDVCWEAPVRWQTLSSGWSFVNSRQYLADTDGDYVDDLISVHRSGAGGMFIWRHVSDYGVLRAPEQIAALATSAGWRWSLSRESVANTWGYWTP